MVPYPPAICQRALMIKFLCGQTAEAAIEAKSIVLKNAGY